MSINKVPERPALTPPEDGRETAFLGQLYTLLQQYGYSINQLIGAPDFGAMPEVSGAPIVESGSNSDGKWTRWADGTQIAWRLEIGSVSDMRTRGGFSGAQSLTNWSEVRVGSFTLPVSFSGAVSVAISGGRVKAPTWVLYNGRNWKNVSEFSSGTFVLTDSVFLHLFAVGRWS